MFHPSGARGRGVRVDKKSGWHLRLGFSGNGPFLSGEFVAAIVGQHEVKQDVVFFVGVQSRDSCFEGWEHSPGKERKVEDEFEMFTHNKRCHFSL